MDKDIQSLTSAVSPQNKVSKSPASRGVVLVSADDMKMGVEDVLTTGLSDIPTHSEAFRRELCSGPKRALPNYAQLFLVQQKIGLRRMKKHINPAHVVVDQAKRDEDRSRRSAAWEIETRPILTELEDVGIKLTSIWSTRKSIDISRAIPIIAHHLTLPYSDRTREGLARLLATKAAISVWPLLVDEYRKAPSGYGVIAPGDTAEYRLGAKDGLAVALSAAVTREKLPELVALAAEKSNGASRLLLLLGIKKFRNPSGKDILRRFADHPDLSLQVREWLKMPKSGPV